MNADKKTSKGGDRTTQVMFGTFLDTTWRMFVPVALFAFIGIGIDRSLDMSPIATLIGLALGIVSSFTLVAIQLKRLTKTLKQEQNK